LTISFYTMAVNGILGRSVVYTIALFVSARSELVTGKHICWFITATRRISNFVAGLTNDDPGVTAPVYKEYRYVQYNGTVPASATVSVSFAPSDDTFRYVIIQQNFSSGGAICLAEVTVFTRGSLLCHKKLM